MSISAMSISSMPISSMSSPSLSGLSSSNQSVPSIAEDFIQLLERIKMGNISISSEEEILAKAYISVGLGESMIAALLYELSLKKSYVDTPKEKTNEVKLHPCPTKVLIAHNIPRDVSHEDLRRTFEIYGPIRDIYIPKNMDKTSPYYGTIKGFALIKFLSINDAIAAYNAEFGRLYIGFKLISIEYAKEGR